jgi:hypothetical protein
VGRDTLTKIEGSKLSLLFSGQADMSKTSGRVFLDRDHEIFNHVVNYLESNQTFLPADPSYDTKKLLEAELKYWTLIH